MLILKFSWFSSEFILVVCHHPPTNIFCFSSSYENIFTQTMAFLSFCNHKKVVKLINKYLLICVVYVNFCFLSCRQLSFSLVIILYLLKYEQFLGFSVTFTYKLYILPSLQNFLIFLLKILFLLRLSTCIFMLQNRINKCTI